VTHLLTRHVLLVGAAVAAVVQIALVQAAAPLQNGAAAIASYLGDAQPARRTVVAVVGVDMVGRARRRDRVEREVGVVVPGVGVGPGLLVVDVPVVAGAAVVLTDAVVSVLPASPAVRRPSGYR
jgi:hypothetical protein